MIEVILAVIVGIIIGVIFALLYFSAKLEQWKIEVEKEIRKDALTRSRAVIKGRLAEQFAPFFAGFGYDPHDARFIGDPVDYIVFDGYTKVKEGKEDVPIKIVLVEVKTGKAGLTYEQRRILEGVKRGLVDFKIVEIEQLQPYIIKPPEDNPTSPHHDRSYSNTKIVKIDKFIRS